jgi:hypothetical protein
MLIEGADMAHEFMQEGQRSSGSTWALPERAATTLEIGPGARVLQVCAGRLWLTTAGTGHEAARDVWLVPGDGVELPAGLTVVLEGWPSARFQLLVPPQACRRGSRSFPARIATWLMDRLGVPGHRLLQPSRP